MGNVALSTVLSRLGLTDNLRLCLDAGDSASYTSGQSWLDRSGNGYDFFLGATSGATTDDPTFNGVAGTLSSAEYFSFDGGDVFQYDTTNETWMENIHKDNAQFTLMAWVYFGSFSAAQGLFGNNASANTGFTWVVTAGALMSLLTTNGGATVLNQASTYVLPATTWVCVGLSLDEGRTLRWFANGPRDTDPNTYASPSSSGATYTTQIGSRGNANNRLVSGTRMASFMAWEGRALTSTEMTAVYQATRNRFGV